MKVIAPRCIKAFTAMLWMFLFFVHEAEGQTTTVYTQQTGNYYEIWTTGTAGTFNQSATQIGMFANGAGTKQVVRWKKFRTDGSGANTSDRALQVGDQFVVTLSATRAFGKIGFALLASPATGSWANRESNYAISVNLDGPAYNSGAWGNWYLRANGGSTSASVINGSQDIYRNFTFTLTLTAPNRMNVVISDGITTNTFNDVLLNTSNPITDYSIFMDDDWDGNSTQNVFWGLDAANQHSVTNTGALNIGGSNTNYTISGVIPNGLVSNSTSTSFINTLFKNGNGTVTLSAANTFSGGVYCNSGTLRLNTANAIPSGNQIFLDGSAAITFGSGISGNVSLGFLRCVSNSGTPPAFNLESSASAVNITFSNFSMEGTSRLSITGWSPSGNKRIYLTGSLPVSELDRIDFVGFGLGAKLMPVTNELVPKFLYYTNAASSGMFSNLSSWLNGMPTLFDGTETIYIQPGFTLTQDMMTLSLLKVVVGGTLIITGPNSIITPNSVNAGVENTGSIIMNTGSVITIGNGATFLNSGSISMSPVATINMNAGSTWAGNGTIGTDGIINFTNGGTITSTSTLPNVIIVGNVNFNTSTIGNSLEIRGGGAVTPNAPFYAPGSTLIYNVSGTYSRNTEWGSNAGQGYPSNVRVNTGTTLNLNVNPISATAFGIGGNLTVQSGATLNTGALNSTSFTVNGNTDINGTFDATGMTGGVNDLFFIGNLSIAGTLSLSNVNGNDLYLSGNWSRTGTFNANNRAVYLRGGNSSISATGGQSFPFLRIEKTAATNTITLNNPVTITNEVSFTTGVVVSTSAIPFIIADNATYTGGSGNSFVDGYLRKVGNDAFTFPVGDRVGSVNHYRTIGISAPTNATDAFDAEFVVANARLLGTVVSPLVRVSKCEYWNLNRFAGSSDVFVTLSWSAQSNCNVTYVDDLSTLVVAHNGGGLWTTRGQSAATGGGASGTVTSAAAVSTFSPFALGSIDQNSNPLPFNLLSFNGRSRTNDIELSFSVKGNDEQQRYLLERSADGRSFVQLNTIAARQNLTEADYTTLDEQPINGWNFYRLTAVDLTGAKKQSQIIRVWFGSRGGKPAVYPNPVQGDAIQLFTGGLLKGTYTVQLRAQDGKLLLSRTWVYDGVAPVYSIATEGKLAAGMYWLSITAPHQPPISIKVIK